MSVARAGRYVDSFSNPAALPFRSSGDGAFMLATGYGDEADHALYDDRLGFFQDSESSLTLSFGGRNAMFTLGVGYGLDRLQELTRSMLRTEEMIVCAVPDDRRREDLSRYAGQFSAMNFVFAADTVAPLAELKLKFSRPLQLRGRLSRCRLAAAALDRLYNKETAIREENKRLCELEKKQELNARGMREKIRCGEKLYWLNKKRIPLQQVHELLAAASIPSDGGTQT